jgi:hypothetical protein
LHQPDQRRNRQQRPEHWGQCVVVIGNSVRSIGYGAFGGCTSLISVSIPSSVTSIGHFVFGLCAGLSSIAVSALNPTYSSADGLLFNKNQTQLILCPPGRSGSYVIPNSITGIEAKAFYGCTALTSVAVPDSVTSIGGSAFAGCTRLTSVMMGNSVRDIGYGAFGDCTRLSSVTIPHGVTFLPGGTFRYCTSLTAIYCEGGVPGSFGGVFDGADQVTLYVLPGTSGWEATFDGRPTALWVRPEPAILDNGPDFGVQGNRFRFAISWATNAAVVVEASTNLAQSVWTPVTTNNLTGGTTPFSHPDWEKHPVRFHRVRVQ